MSCVPSMQESSIAQQVHGQFDYQSIRQEKVQELIAQLQQKEEMIKELQEENQRLKQENQHLIDLAIVRQKTELRLNWETRKAPRPMYRGSVTQCNNMAYFRPRGSSQVHSYHSGSEKWSTLHPECPRKEFTLTVISDLVTAVGGKYLNEDTCTNTLLSFNKGWRKRWVEHFQPMPTKRTLTAVVCHGKALVVAGGVTGREGGKFDKLPIVEVMDTETHQWSIVSSLPQPINEGSATVCGDSIYLVGRDHQEYYSTNSVFTCSLSALLRSRTGNCSVWNKINDLPLESSTCVLNGQLLAVGGRDQGRDTNNIYAYNREASSWNIISHMPTHRFQCLVTVLPANKLMVVGGKTDYSEAVKDEVEIATLSQ